MKRLAILLVGVFIFSLAGAYAIVVDIVVGLPPQLEISPNHAGLADTFTMAIDKKEDPFQIIDIGQGGIENGGDPNDAVTGVWLSLDDTVIHANSFSDVDWVSATAEFTIQEDTPFGKYDVHVTELDGSHFKLGKGFEVKDDNYEPDWNMHYAKPIKVDGVGQRRSINPAGDVDWVSFTIEDAFAEVVIETAGSEGDTLMGLLDEDGNLIIEDDDSGEGQFSIINKLLPKGTYYIAIVEYNNKVVIEKYILTVTATEMAMPQVTSIEGNLFRQGEVANVTITGLNTRFDEYGSSTVRKIWISKNGVDVYAQNIAIVDNSTLSGQIVLPDDAEVGGWDVCVESRFDQYVAPLVDGLTVYYLPDVNGDGIIDAGDMSILSRHWLEPVASEGMVKIPGTTYDMGNHYSGGYSEEKPVHTVTVDSFYMSIHEVTNAQYCRFLNEAYKDKLIYVGYAYIGSTGKVYAVGDDDYSEPYAVASYGPEESQIKFKDYQFIVDSKEGHDISNHPVVFVSWFGAKAYCDYYGYQLPTEAQWELAARGGEFYYKYPWGSNTLKAHNFYGSGGNPLDFIEHPFTSPVGHYGREGNYGLCDIIGNVWEWCSDYYDSSYYSESPENNPLGPESVSNGYRSVRGGGWYNNYSDCRVSNRDGSYPGNTNYGTGFRVCLPYGGE